MVATIRIHRTGGPEVLALDDVELAPPGRGEARVAHTAIGVNFLDCYHRSGLYPLPTLPHGLGSEAVGVIEALGDGVHGLAVGDRVAYAGGVAPGSYATARNVPAWRLVPAPASVDDVTLAASLLKGLTAEFLVRRVFKIGPGHRVLVHAAAGGVGTLLCQWLRHVGATVVGVVSTAAKADAAFAAGCHQVVVRAEADVADAVARFTHGRGVDVCYDSVGKDTLRESLRCLRKRGLLVSFGNASGRPDPVALAELQAGAFFLTRPTLHDYTSTRNELLHAAEVFGKLLAGGVLRQRVHAALPLAEAAAAHRLLESRTTTGALVLLP
ncbi:MAG: quinone oxidoreductase [Planctomycetes bacterium]|nr:quinone oxidoreductase [Planctomycetota bacterium]